jgi:hypothetical protein
VSSALTGHYVNYRKQASAAREPLLPESDFRLYAVTSRFPHNLHSESPLAEVGEGIYDCRRGTDTIRVIVTGQVSKAAHNAIWHLFSASAEKVGYGAEHYRQRSEKTSSLLTELFRGYETEGIHVPYTMADFEHDFVKERVNILSPEERLKGLSPEERLAGLSPEKRLEGLSPEKRLEGLSPEERLEGLSPKQLEQLRASLERRSAKRPRRPRGRS